MAMFPRDRKGFRIGRLAIGFGSEFKLAPSNSEGVIAYEAETDAYVARMSVAPDATRKGLLNTLIKSLKDAGVYAKRDAYWLPASHDAATGLLNVKSASHAATVVGTCTFTADRGYQGNGTTGYLNLNYNPAVDGVTHQQNSASIMAWINATASDVGSGAATIARTTSVATFMRPRTAANILEGRVNGSATKQYGAVVTRLGHRAISRTTSTLTRGYAAGVQVGTDDTQASVALASETMLLGKLQTTFAADRWAASAIGGGLTSAEILAEYNAFNTYLTAIGAA